MTEQLPLFQTVPSRRDAKTARELGITRAAAKAEREAGPSWTETAALFLRRYAREGARGQPFLTEDAREAAARFVRPANPKAWGAAVRLAVACGWIVHAGFGPRRCGHLCPSKTWKAGAGNKPAN